MRPCHQRIEPHQDTRPGLKLGWLEASPSMLRRIARRGYLDSGGSVAPFTSEVVACLLEAEAADGDEGGGGGARRARRAAAAAAHHAARRRCCGRLLPLRAQLRGAVRVRARRASAACACVGASHRRLLCMGEADRPA